MKIICGGEQNVYKVVEVIYLRSITSVYHFQQHL